MDDLIFKNRNKEYGAYKLRKQYNKILFFSLIISSVLVFLLVLIPFLINIKNQYSEDFVIRTNIVAAELMPINQVKENLPKPQPKILKTLVVNKPQEKNEMKNDTAQKNNDKIDTAKLAELNKKAADYEEALIESQASFSLGTRQAFSLWVDQNFNRNLIKKNKQKGTILLQFSVNEKGIVDSAKVIQSLDAILDNEAKRVILNSPRWKPFIYKGHKRRIYYNFPINIVAN
jgi:Gram-negative bacterial tonB protein.